MVSSDPISTVWEKSRDAWGPCHDEQRLYTIMSGKPLADPRLSIAECGMTEGCTLRFLGGLLGGQGGGESSRDADFAAAAKTLAGSGGAGPGAGASAELEQRPQPQHERLVKTLLAKWARQMAKPENEGLGDAVEQLIPSGPAQDVHRGALVDLLRLVKDEEDSGPVAKLYAKAVALLCGVELSQWADQLTSFSHQVSKWIEYKKRNNGHAAGSIVPDVYVSGTVWFPVPLQQQLAHMAAALSQERSRNCELESRLNGLQRSSAALNQRPTPPDVAEEPGGSGEAHDEEWRHVGRELCKTCPNEAAFAKALPRALPNVIPLMMEEHSKFGKCKLRDRAGKMRWCWSTASQDRFINLTALHDVSDTATSKVFAECLRGVAGLEEVAEELSNAGKGIGDTVGRALMKASAFTEMMVAAKLAARRQPDGFWVRVEIGLSGDKTKHPKQCLEEYSVYIRFVDIDGRYQEYCLALEQVQPFIREDGSDREPTTAEIVKGAEMELGVIKRSFERIQKWQEILGIELDERVQWHDITTSCTDHAGCKPVVMIEPFRKASWVVMPGKGNEGKSYPRLFWMGCADHKVAIMSKWCAIAVAKLERAFYVEHGVDTPDFHSKWKTSYGGIIDKFVMTVSLRLIEQREKWLEFVDHEIKQGRLHITKQTRIRIQRCTDIIYLTFHHMAALWATLDAVTKYPRTELLRRFFEWRGKRAAPGELNYGTTCWSDTFIRACLNLPALLPMLTVLKNTMHHLYMPMMKVTHCTAAVGNPLVVAEAFASWSQHLARIVDDPDELKTLFSDGWADRTTTGADRVTAADPEAEPAGAYTDTVDAVDTEGFRYCDVEDPEGNQTGIAYDAAEEAARSAANDAAAQASEPDMDMGQELELEPPSHAAEEPMEEQQDEPGVEEHPGEKEPIDEDPECEGEDEEGHAQPLTGSEDHGWEEDDEEEDGLPPTGKEVDHMEDIVSFEALQFDIEEEHLEALRRDMRTAIVEAVLSTIKDHAALLCVSDVGPQKPLSKCEVDPAKLTVENTARMRQGTGDSRHVENSFGKSGHLHALSGNIWTRVTLIEAKIHARWWLSNYGYIPLEFLQGLSPRLYAIVSHEGIQRWSPTQQGGKHKSQPVLRRARRVVRLLETEATVAKAEKTTRQREAVAPLLAALNAVRVDPAHQPALSLGKVVKLDAKGELMREDQITVKFLKFLIHVKAPGSFNGKRVAPHTTGDKPRVQVM